MCVSCPAFPDQLRSSATLLSHFVLEQSDFVFVIYVSLCCEVNLQLAEPLAPVETRVKLKAASAAVQEKEQEREERPYMRRRRTMRTDARSTK